MNRSDNISTSEGLTDRVISCDVRRREPGFEVSKEYVDITREYLQLRATSPLSDAQADRLEEVLEQATNDPLLNLLIGEMEHILGHQYNILTFEWLSELENLQSRLQEHGFEAFLCSRHQSIHGSSQLDHDSSHPLANQDDDLLTPLAT
jgi:hypothetical protein